ncbi:uncharacterized protein LOC131676899 [Topomyia yanbarensis]|uniref:uncharacterized protein LOC131676899 n=1 Tax=Topomyia yanbarensis TaxID=2498891 RepID=UPI00273CD7B9|nr:uncharacterized protein LOC131676899 [Topomyia yanbarensis]
MVGTRSSEAATSPNTSGKGPQTKSTIGDAQQTASQPHHGCSATFCRQASVSGSSCTPFHTGVRLRGLGRSRREVKQTVRNLESKPQSPTFIRNTQYLPTLKESRVLPTAEAPTPVCRFCLETSGNSLEPIFQSKPNAGVPTPEDILLMLGIEVKPDDKLPQGMCVTCVSKINYMKRIRKQFQETDRKLHEQLRRSNVSHYSEDIESLEKEMQIIDDKRKLMEVTSTESEMKVVGYGIAMENDAYFITVDHNPEQHYQNEQQLLTEDQITIEGVEEEIESTPIKSENNIEPAVDESPMELLYTGNFTEAADSAQIKEEPRFDDFASIDELEEMERLAEALKDKPEKRRCYGRFRYH